MANGIGGLAFPTFAQPKGDGITQVKMAPSQVRFPTARSGGSSSSTNPLAGIAPFALDYGIDYLFDKFGKESSPTITTAPEPDVLSIED